MDFAHAMIANHRTGVSHIPCWLITDTRSFHRYVVGGHLPIPRVPGAPVPTGRTVPQAWLDSGGGPLGGHPRQARGADRGSVYRTAAHRRAFQRAGA